MNIEVELEDDINRCPMCFEEWGTLDNIIYNKDVVFVGYQANHRRPEHGMFLFLHQKSCCGTSFIVYAYKIARYLKLQVPYATNNLDFCEVNSCGGKAIRDLIQVLKEKKVIYKKIG